MPKKISALNPPMPMPKLGNSPAAYAASHTECLACADVVASLLLTYRKDMSIFTDEILVKR